MIKIILNLTLLFILGACEDKLKNLNPMAPVVDTLDQGSIPTITLKGSNPITLNKGSAYVEPGFTATDVALKDITAKVVTTNNINQEIVGDYLVRYNVSDDQGRKAIEVTRSVKVIQPLNTSNGTIKAVTYPNQGKSPYEYHEYLPKGYDQNPSTQYPLVIFLHGLGEQGGVNFSTGQRSGAAFNNVLFHGPLKRVKEGVHFPAIIVHPQTPVWWNSSTIKTFLDVLKTKYRVNTKKVYVTGLSMGGGGTWDFARAYPNEVAAIVPICGASAIGNVDQARPLLPIPVWAFHARGDGTVPLSNSYSFLNFIYQAQTGKTDKIASLYVSTTSTSKTAAIENKAIWMMYEGVNSGTSKDKLLTIYPHNSHDSWTETYKNQLMWDWLWTKAKP